MQYDTNVCVCNLSKLVCTYMYVTLLNVVVYIQMEVEHGGEAGQAAAAARGAGMSIYTSIYL